MSRAGGGGGGRGRGGGGGGVGRGMGGGVGGVETSSVSTSNIQEPKKLIILFKKY